MGANNPYIHYAASPARYAFQWRAGQGGVIPARRTHAPSSSLGSLGGADMLEGGYGDPNTLGWPAFSKTSPKGCCPMPGSIQAASLGATAVEYTNIIGTIATDIVKGIGTTIGSVASSVAKATRPIPSYRTTMGPRGRNGLGAIPVWDGLTSTQKTIALAALGAGAFWLLTRKKRKNPWRVYSRTRGVSGSLVFTSKKRANEYASYLRRARKPARVRRTRR